MKADTLGDRAVIRDPVNEVDYRTLYRDGLKLQSELLALEKTVGGQRESSASILAPFFPDLGFFQEPAIPGVAPIPYAASTLPMYPGEILILIFLSLHISKRIKQSNVPKDYWALLPPRIKIYIIKIIDGAILILNF